MLQCLAARRSGSSEAFLARARAHQRLEDYDMAYEDYRAANQLAPSPRIAACLGYCLSRLGEPDPAIAFYRECVKRRLRFAGRAERHGS